MTAMSLILPSFCKAATNQVRKGLKLDLKFKIQPINLWTHKLKHKEKTLISVLSPNISVKIPHICSTIRIQIFCHFILFLFSCGDAERNCYVVASQEICANSQGFAG